MKTRNLATSPRGHDAYTALDAFADVSSLADELATPRAQNEAEIRPYNGWLGLGRYGKRIRGHFDRAVGKMGLPPAPDETRDYIGYVTTAKDNDGKPVKVGIFTRRGKDADGKVYIVRRPVNGE